MILPTRTSSPVLPSHLQTYLTLRRVCECLLLIILLPPALVLIAFLALLVRLDSRGPAFFRQKRIGQDGRPFGMLKLRSMHKNSEVGSHEAHVRALISNSSKGERWIRIADDPRVTRIGAILRQTGLDELPQIFNILQGDMSLIGPRPALPYEVELWKDWHHQRLVVPPGITGLWQVEGRDQVDFDSMVRMDLDYIDRLSPLLDLSLLLRTPRSILVRSNKFEGE